MIERAPWFEGLPTGAHARLAQNARIRSYRVHDKEALAAETELRESEDD